MFCNNDTSSFSTGQWFLEAVLDGCRAVCAPHLFHYGTSRGVIIDQGQLNIVGKVSSSPVSLWKTAMLSLCINAISETVVWNNLASHPISILAFNVSDLELAPYNKNSTIVIAKLTRSELDTVHYPTDLLLSQD